MCSYKLLGVEAVCGTDVLVDTSVAASLLVLGVDEGCYIWLLNEHLRWLHGFLEAFHQLEDRDLVPNI